MNVYWVLNTSVGFNFGVFSQLIFMAQWMFAFSGSEMGSLGWGGDMVGVGDENTTTVSVVSFRCLCCLLWTCFMLPSAVSVFGFGHVGVWAALFVVNTYFYIFYSSSGFG